MALPERYKKTKKSFDAGGMSDVEVYTDVHLERDVVIKTLKDGVDPKRILDEIAALQTIRSKHVVQMYDVIKNDKGGIIAVVEEYISGDDLTSYPKPKAVTEFLELIYQIAEGISDIHAQDQIHRDIKRQNMKFDAEGCLKIFDFGLARSSAGASTMGQFGTPGYMAPELFEVTAGGACDFHKGCRRVRLWRDCGCLSPGQHPEADAREPTNSTMRRG